MSKEWLLIVECLKITSYLKHADFIMVFVCLQAVRGELSQFVDEMVITSPMVK